MTIQEILDQINKQAIDNGINENNTDSVDISSKDNFESSYEFYSQSINSGERE